MWHKKTSKLKHGKLVLTPPTFLGLQYLPLTELTNDETSKSQKSKAWFFCSSRALICCNMRWKTAFAWGSRWTHMCWFHSGSLMWDLNKLQTSTWRFSSTLWRLIALNTPVLKCIHLNKNQCTHTNNHWTGVLVTGIICADGIGSHTTKNYRLCISQVLGNNHIRCAHHNRVFNAESMKFNSHPCPGADKDASRRQFSWDACKKQGIATEVLTCRRLLIRCRFESIADILTCHPKWLTFLLDNGR